ncbi:amino acid adenylation domain-containing protein [Paucibacter sp. APW11]|uniref:Amino acid adenylation domain-containing protein n=1 Tax=Roseateles aquae TaxID=3077235 RepID=A0ABU3P949_9BURK|nr:non-ribosomal peptide synthetase [Paucibacter sp. APW11]MDT8999092.1 amino acid adenylation domain-containing protein [Paucibacter sp. APW11]
MSAQDTQEDARRRLLEQRLRKAQSATRPATQLLKRPAMAGIPMSSVQRRLWFLDQWQPGNAAYNIPLLLSLHGELDMQRLSDALLAVAQRHEILRTSYRDQGGEPEPFLRDVSECRLHIIDVEPDVALSELQALATQEAGRAFSLDQEPPLRACLWRAGAQRSLLLLNLHHIAADGWSVGLLLRELSAAYKGRSSAAAPDATQLQYADFAHWQAQTLDPASVERQLEIWERKLVGAPALLELPTDRARPQVQSNAGAIEWFQLDMQTQQRLHEVAQQERVTPFIIFLAALATLYQRYTGQGDLVLGTPVAGRHAPEWEALIGCFVNTVAMRVRPAHVRTARQLLQQTREDWMTVLDHQSLPFEKLVERLAPERQFAHTPVFQVMLSINNIPRAALELEGVTAQELAIDIGRSKFDLSWAIDDLQEGLGGSVTYNTDLFERDTVRRMLTHLQTLLSDMLQRLDAPLSQLAWLPENERQALLTQFNNSAQDYPELRDVLALFSAHVTRAPAAPAVVHEGNVLSYRELDEWSNRVAACLRAKGAGPDQRVGVYMERSHRTVVAIMGILKAGAAYVPIDSSYPVDRVRFMLEDADARLCLTEAHLLAPFEPGGRIEAICLDRDAAMIAAYPLEPVPVLHDERHLMYVLFTSGSTGRPKGVGVEHRHYLNYLQGAMRRLNLPQACHFAMVSTFAADLGTTMLYGALSSGGCVHVMSHARVTDPQAFAAYMRQHRPDVLKLVPSHFETLSSLAPLADLLPQRCLVFAGEACHWDMVARVRAERPGLDIQNHYGPTESSVAALAYTVPAELPAQEGPLPLGEPLGNVQTYVLDPGLQLVGIGIPGELHIGGTGITRGYLARPALSAERFVPDPFGPPGARLYRTGDLARVGADGRVEFLGRIDHQVKIRGYRVETAEIEALITDEAVLEARVILREDTPGDKRLVAYLVFAPTTPPSEYVETIEALRHSLRKVLPDYMVPTAFVPLAGLPLNANGKLDRFALPAPSQEHRRSVATSRPPSSALEMEIAGVWSALLGIDSFGVDEDFFELGGDSFKAVRAVRGIGHGLSVMDLFRHPTVAALAVHLSGAAPLQHEGLLHRLSANVASADGVSWVCVPFGGGSAISYLSLSAAIPDGDALHAIELPGHDFARRDDPLQDFDGVARRCADEIVDSIQGDVLLYGHCLGAGMAVAIAQQLQARGFTRLLGVLVGGSFPMPRLPGRIFDAISRVLPTDGLISNRSILDGLLVTGGAAGDEAEEELEFLVRNMRHDGRQAEDFYTRHYRAPDAPLLDVPLLCVVGERDRATEFHAEEYLEWRRFSRHVTLQSIPRAGHFFQKHQARELAALGSHQARMWRSAQREAPASRTAALASPASTRPALGTLWPFVLVSLGQLVSVIGSGLSTFALGVWVYQQTGAISDFATISALGILPGILVLPIAGAIADRWDRRTIMLCCDAAGLSLAATAAALAWSQQLSIAALYIVATLSAVASAFRQPAYTAAIAQLAPKRYLGHANGFVQLGGASGLLIGQLFGGVLMLRLGLDRVLMLDIASFALAFAALLAVRFPQALFKRQEEPFWKEMTYGWRYILKRQGLVALAVFFALGNCLASMVLVLVTPLVMSFSGAIPLGEVMAMNGAGMLLGSLIMSIWGGLRDRVLGMVGFVALFGGSAIAISIAPQLSFAMAGMFGIGLCTAFINAHWLSLVQVKVGLELQGRVVAANQMLARSLMPLGTVLAGWMVDSVIHPLFKEGAGGTLFQQWAAYGNSRAAAVMIVTLGLLSIILTALGLLYQPLRRLERLLPDAIPDAVILDKDAIQQQADAALARPGSPPARASTSTSGSPA